MTSHRNAYVTEAVERASRRAAATVHQEMSRGLYPLATIASTATLIGLTGTIAQMIVRTFYSCGGTWSSCDAPIGGRLSEAMGLTAFGLLVAILSYWFYSYLSDQMEALDVEMENASIDLVNRLVTHLGPLRTSGNAHRLPGKFESNGETAGPPAGPRLSIERIYRHGLLELIWPRLESVCDADSVLRSGMWVSLAYGLLGWLTYDNERRPAAGVVVFLFLAVAGLGVRTGSVGSILAIFAFYASACVACVVPFGWTFAAVCLAAAPLLLVGSLKAARFVAAERTAAFIETEVEWMVKAKKLWAALRPLPGILIGLLGVCAGLAVLFGTVLGLDAMGRDYSMEPNLHAGDWLVSVNAPVNGGIHRGDIVAFPYWGGFGAERVVGLPGDRIQVKAGKLILNGKFVPEPYVKKAYRGGPGDFPMPSEAFPDGSMRSDYEDAYGQNLKKGDVFIVPRGAYFLLNDDRNELMDSRVLGPLSKHNVVGRPLLAFSPWSLPRFLL